MKLPKSYLTHKNIGKIFNFISVKILNLPYRARQAGLKGFNKIPAPKIFKIQKITGFLFEASLLFLAT